MRAAVLLAVAAAVLAAAAPAAASSDRMQLACEDSDLVVERTNGASWWGSDGSVYTTAYLRVVDPYGAFEKHYGHVAAEHLVCEAEHDAHGWTSRWTVHLVLAR